MEKLPKKILKRFESIKWDTDGYLPYQIDVNFSFSKLYIKDKTTIIDLFIQANDKIPLFSLIVAHEKPAYLIAFGQGKNTVYKKLRNANFNCEVLNVGLAMNMAHLGCKFNPEHKITVNLA